MIAKRQSIHVNKEWEKRAKFKQKAGVKKSKDVVSIIISIAVMSWPSNLEILGLTKKEKEMIRVKKLNYHLSFFKKTIIFVLKLEDLVCVKYHLLGHLKWTLIS